MRVSIGAATDVGRSRTVNQDVFLAEEPLFGVADGMGGHLAGDVAASTAVEIVKERFHEGPPSGSADLAAYLSAANEAVWQKSNEDAAFEGMGTTFTLVHLQGDHVAAAHVGDSRAYLLRDGQLQQVTEDHTLVQRMVQEGRLERSEAAHHPQRNVITRALGIDADLEADQLTFEVLPGDRLLLCSDGLNSMLDDGTIGNLLGGSDDMQAVAQSLVEAANNAGGEDNITVVVLGFDLPKEASGPAIAPHEERATTEPRPHHNEEAIEPEAPRGPRRVRKKLIVALVALVVVGGLAYGAASYALSNSWYVGADDSGVITIYQGIPEKVLGVSLSSSEETTDLLVSDLPAFLQEDVSAGIKRDSLDEARATVRDLEARTIDFGSKASP